MNGYHFASRGQARTFADAAYISAADSSQRAFESLTLVANAPGALNGTTLTAQVKKATDAAGTGAVNVGPLITKTAVGTQHLEIYYDVPSLGADANGVPYTHVTLDTGGTTAATIDRIAVRSASRYSA
jgi:hypothetical protein